MNEIDKSDEKDIKGIEEEILKIHPEIFDDIPPEKRHEVIRALSVMSITHEKMHAGPIPDPQTLAKYNEIIPDGANRIMTQSEAQSNHRIDIEKRVVKSNNIQSYMGQIFAFLIALFAMYISWNLCMNDHAIVGGCIGGGTVIALVSIFILGKKSQDQE